MSFCLDFLNTLLYSDYIARYSLKKKSLWKQISWQYQRHKCSCVQHKVDITNLYQLLCHFVLENLISKFQIYSFGSSFSYSYLKKCYCLVNLFCTFPVCVCSCPATWVIKSWRVFKFEMAVISFSSPLATMKQIHSTEWPMTILCLMDLRQISKIISDISQC